MKKKKFNLKNQVQKFNPIKKIEVKVHLIINSIWRIEINIDFKIKNNQLNWIGMK